MLQSGMLGLTTKEFHVTECHVRLDYQRVSCYRVVCKAWLPKSFMLQSGMLALTTKEFHVTEWYVRRDYQRLTTNVLFQFRYIHLFNFLMIILIPPSHQYMIKHSVISLLIYLLFLHEHIYKYSLYWLSLHHYSVHASLHVLHLTWLGEYLWNSLT